MTLSNINWVTRTLDIKTSGINVTGTPFADDVNYLTTVRFITSYSMHVDEVLIYQ